MYLATCAIDINFYLNNSNPRSNPEISFAGRRKRGRRGYSRGIRSLDCERSRLFFTAQFIANQCGRVEYKTRSRSEASPGEPRRIPKGPRQSKFTFSSIRDSALLLFRRCGYTPPPSPLPSSTLLKPPHLPRYNVQRRRTCSHCAM